MVSWLKPEVTTRQIDQICTTFWLGTNQATGAPNGGSVSVLPTLPVTQCDI